MLDSVDVDAAVFCKKIYDCLRCAVCDKGSGGRLRFACGHTACTDCANSSDCSLCFTNSQTSQPVVDDVLKARVENAGNLLTSYQDLFSLDVYKKQKLSEKLKIEKQLFPACIQAPSKYYNKRKSSCNSFKGKENQLLFLGEEVSSLKNIKMDHKINLVKNWLADNEQIQRKPLVDLNVNQQRIINDNNTLIANNFTASKKRKKSTLKSLKSKKQKFSDNVNSDQKHYFKNKEIFLGDEIDAYTKNQNNPDTVQVDDEPIIIDDSQTDVVDKDKEAWLKVLETHMNELNEQTKESNKIWGETVDMVVIKPTESDQYKVPFYKKSCLKDPCKICDEIVSENSLNSTENNEVTIVVTNNLFVTTIKVSKDFETNVNTKSIEVQTEGIQIKTVQNSNDKNLNDKASFICSKVDQEILKNNFVKTNTNNAPVIFSEDLFSEERPVNISKLNKVNSDVQYICNIDANSRKREHLVIDESDSDDSSVLPNHMEVKADIHRSCTEFDYGVLSEVRNEVEHSQKSRRPARGLTPDSSNSSEKENYHPNKPKKAKRDKKNTHKK
ncbi:hypothetical protein K1T71_008738 [Dendrolimus kikuchii]|uniref:Uncharacterized protein n=1 Tax=Dendrolimus kikuchii TaxID=765133 RepID=A0ACC1CV82_9NEOP|nr:hypothetical protein K1T71_008738 [Dendrolimus kikuchii]